MFYSKPLIILTLLPIYLFLQEIFGAFNKPPILGHNCFNQFEFKAKGYYEKFQIQVTKDTFISTTQNTSVYLLAQSRSRFSKVLGPLDKLNTKITIFIKIKDPLTFGKISSFSLLSFEIYMATKCFQQVSNTYH